MAAVQGRLFIPWSAVNLADYFLVRRGNAAGLAAEWPFVSQPDYTGPLVKTLGGADISWLAGRLVRRRDHLFAPRCPYSQHQPP